MSERIIVAEDDEGLRFLLRAVLEEHGFEVETVDNGDALVRAAHEAPPDLLLVDLMMPVMDGIEAIRQLRHDTRTGHLPMLVMTASNNPQQAVRGFENGADDYITKPFNNDVLIARIRANLRRAARSSVNNPLTGLPGNQLITAEVNHRLQQGQPFALLYVDVNNFKAFNDAYGFERGDRLIRLLAQLISDLHKHEDNNEEFIGHIGGDDFVILVPPERAVPCAEHLIAVFDAAIPELYDPIDRERGYLVGADRYGVQRRFPLSGISIGIVDAGRRHFDSFAEVAGVAAEVKSFAKKLSGSRYVQDGRRGDGKSLPPQLERRGQSPLVAIAVAVAELQTSWLGWSSAQGFRSLVYPTLPTSDQLLADGPDMLLLDLRIPEAWPWLERIHLAPITIPIVALVPDAGERPRALAAGAMACFTVYTEPAWVSASLGHLLRQERVT